MSQYNSEDTLKNLFPIVIVLVVLVAGIIIMPTLTADPRSRASEPKPTISQPPKITPTEALKIEIVCSDLYSPVCDKVTNTTYPNSCEANLAGAKNYTLGECLKTDPIIIPSSN